MADFTSQALANTIMELLEEKSLDKITVKDIVDRCGVSRNTFYYHFADVFDLLQWIIDQKADEIISKTSRSQKWREGFLESLEFIYDKRKIIVHVYGSINREKIQRDLRQIATIYANGIVNELVQGGNYSQKTVEIVADFYANAALSSTLNWIEKGMNEKPEVLATIYNELFTGTLQAALDSAERANLAINGDK